MVKFLSQYLVSEKHLAVLWFGSFISICSGVKIGMIESDTGLGLIAFTGIVLGLRKYEYEKKKDRKESLVQIVRFYQKEVLPAQQSFIDRIEKEKFKSTRIKLDKLDIDWVVEMYPVESKEQMKITKKDDLYTVQTVNILNNLEEFSMRIINAESVREDFLTPLRATFIQIVESNAIALMRHKLVDTGEDTYSKTLEIYYEWKDLVDNKTIEQRMTKEWSKLYTESV